MFQIRDSNRSSLLNRWIGVCATAFITMVWSDLWYYASFQALSNSGYGQWYSILSMYLSHLVCAFVLLDLCSFCHLRDASALFLAAAVSGWILTGLFTTSFYDSLPVSVAWRGLCWYALFAVFIGLWLVRTLLHQTQQIWIFMAFCVATGFIWTSWSIFWMHSIGEFQEFVPSITSVTIFLFITTGILILSYYMLDKMYDVEQFQPSLIERLLLIFCLIFATIYNIVLQGYFYMMVITWLPTLIITAFFLRRYRNISLRVRSNAQEVWNALALPTRLNGSSNGGDRVFAPTHFNLAYRDIVSNLTDSEYEKQNVWVLLIIPSVGILTYSGVVELQSYYLIKLPTGTIINIAGIVLGFAAVLFALWRITFLNERVFLRRQYFRESTNIMEELEREIEVELEMVAMEVEQERAAMEMDRIADTGEHEDDVKQEEEEKEELELELKPEEEKQISSNDKCSN